MRLARTVAVAVAALGLLAAPVLGTTAAGSALSAGGPGVVTASPSTGARLTAPTIQEGDLNFRVHRVGGTDRYATAAALSRRFVPAGTPVAYVTNGAAATDAVVAGPAAARTGGPLLYVTADSVPASTRTELGRLRPGRIVVVGGTSGVSAAVVSTLSGYTTGGVTRLTAADRYTRSAVVSRAAFPEGAGVAYVTAGASWPDSLSAGAAAAVQDAPVLLTATDRLPTAVRDELLRLAPGRIMLVGGSTSVSEAVAEQLRGIAPTERLAGADRYGTALAVSRRVFGSSRPGVVIAGGEVYADALASVTAATYTRGPVLLARRDSLPYRSELDRLTPRTAYVVGATSTLSAHVPRAAQRERGVCWAGNPGKPSKQVLTTVSGTDTRKLAFTLDMGGRLEGAAALVDYLVANQVCTTFFPTSIMADTAEGRRVMAKIKAHPELFEVGNHTVHHCDLVLGGGGSPTAAPCDRSMTQTFVRSELSSAEPVIERLSGTESRPYWRPPYGSHNTFVRDQAAAVGYPVTVMWTRDTIDWDPATTAAQIVSRTTSPLPPSGAIVLAHMGGYRTAEALPEIVRVLRANGYTMTTVSDMRDG